MAVKELTLLKAFDLFATYGIKNVSMEDIARSMEISKRTIYELFKDKEELLIESVEFNYRKARIYLGQLENESLTSISVFLLFFDEVMKQPRWFSTKFYDDLNRYPKVMQKLETEKQLFYKRCFNLLTKGIKEGVFHSDIDVEMLALLAKEQGIRFLPTGSFGNYAATEVYHVMVYTFIKGISTDKGLHLVERHLLKQRHDRRYHASELQ